MDWSKAKNILIVALIITNLILLAAIYQNMDDSNRGEQMALKENTILLLQDHDIYVDETVIPNRNYRLPVMSVRYRSITQEMVQQVVEQEKIVVEPNASEETYGKAAEKLLKAMNVDSDSMVCRKVRKDNQNVSVIYGMEYQGYSLDNSMIIVTFEEGKPLFVSASWAEPVSMGRNKKHVMSAPMALVKFMTNLEGQQIEESEPVHIEEMKLVYWMESYTENGGVSEDTAVPYWCICYNDGKRAYIAAYEQ